MDLDFSLFPDPRWNPTPHTPLAPFAPLLPFPDFFFFVDVKTTPLFFFILRGETSLKGYFLLLLQKREFLRLIFPFVSPVPPLAFQFIGRGDALFELSSVRH